jgi:hypothetical protein
MTAAQELRKLLNGPVLAGVGATVDAGLTTDAWHVLPWDPKVKVTIGVSEVKGKLEYTGTDYITPANIELKTMVKYARFNVDAILRIDSLNAKAASVDSSFKTALRDDLTRILALSMAYGYYSDECRAATNNEKQTIEKEVVTDELVKTLFNVEGLNRAATFILARMHTKYQTNHAIGGSPMQASMASSVRAFYQVSAGTAEQAAAKEKVDYIAKCLYWALHPLNETLLIPAVIQNSRITESSVHKFGPKPTTIATEEYFNIRAHTPPAASHHFYVAAAAIKALRPMGVLNYLPNPTDVDDVLTGLEMISTYGAALHPAARFWGLDRVTCNQKLVEPICANLGYAVKKLMPASSLAASPILKKEDALHTGWKTLIDNLRAAIDERGKELLSSDVFESIQKAIAPSAAELEGLDIIDKYLREGEITSRKELPPVTRAGDDDEEERDEEEEESDSDDSDDDDENKGQGGGNSSKKDKGKGPDSAGAGGATTSGKTAPVTPPKPRSASGSSHEGAKPISPKAT